MEVTVKLATREGAAHISGILAGFILLAKRGELTLRIQDERQGSPIAREALLETEIDGRTVVFDLMDGYFYNDPAAVLALFRRADVVFKRSFAQDAPGSRSCLPAQQKHPCCAQRGTRRREQPDTKCENDPVQAAFPLCPLYAQTGKRVQAQKSSSVLSQLSASQSASSDAKLSVLSVLKLRSNAVMYWA